MPVAVSQRALWKPWSSAACMPTMSSVMCLIAPWSRTSLAALLTIDFHIPSVTLLFALLLKMYIPVTPAYALNRLCVALPHTLKICLTIRTHLYIVGVLGLPSRFDLQAIHALGKSRFHCHFVEQSR